MKKHVSLVTLHRSANYGSVLQALATQVVLERMGYDVTVLDYYPERSGIPSMLRELKHKKPILERNPLALAVARAVILPSYVKRRRNFDRFIERNLKMSERTYRSPADFEADPPEADVYVTGSDQVWNSAWNGGIDEPLFLSFTPEGARRLAFSASFGKGSLDEGERARTAELLARYERITVREDSGAEIVRSLGLEATQVLDPTLLIPGAEWEERCSSDHPEGDYILMYNINHNAPLDRFVQALSKKTGMPVYYISYQLHDCVKRGRMRCCVPVEEFLGLIRHARFVACDSFHCAAFSVSFNREFAIVMPERFGTRLSSLMRVVGLEDRIVGEGDLGVFDEPIDWASANARLEAERGRSLGVLEAMMAGDAGQGAAE